MGNRRNKIVTCEVPAVNPCRKVRHATHGAAMVAMHKVRKNGKKRSRGWMSVYYCPACDAWHFGHGGRTVER